MNVDMTSTQILVLVVVAIAVIALIAWLYARNRRAKTEKLRQHFGTEYERTVRETGSERQAEAKLAEREKRVETFKIRDLDSSERERYIAQWQQVQSQFVDSPKGAVIEADDLLTTVMKDRGYPMVDFDQRAADLSVHHPTVIQNYRTAHRIALRLGQGEATTEDMRTAMIHYRSLFDELVQAPTNTPVKTTTVEAA